MHSISSTPWTWGIGALESKHYFPQFLWRFFLANIGPKWADGSRIHVYDVYNDVLSETRRIPQSRSVFADFLTPDLEGDCLAAIKHAEDVFLQLEAAAEQVLEDLLRKLVGIPLEESVFTRRSVTLDARAEYTLIKYLIFLRYRNSEQYHETVTNLGIKSSRKHRWIKHIPKGPLRRRAVLRSMCDFLEHQADGDYRKDENDKHSFFEDIEDQCWIPIWRGTTELTLGIASEAQEFIITDRCYGNLDDVDPDGSCSGSYNLFFPVTPSVAVYLMTMPSHLPHVPLTVIPWESNPPSLSPAQGLPSISTQKRKHVDGDHDVVATSSKRRKLADELLHSGTDGSDPLCIMDCGDMMIVEESTHINPHAPFEDVSNASHSSYSVSTVTCITPVISRTVQIICDIETVPDVHLRNAIILRTSPQYMFFSSLPSLITAIIVTPTLSSSVSSSSNTPYPLDTSLSKLKSKCREKHIRECLMKTLVVKGEVAVTDLTNEVSVCGKSPVEHGSFADIWRGEWIEKHSCVLGLSGGVKRAVALKVLRQCMDNDIKDKLLKRLKDEVLTWHRLRHPHIAPLHGIVQLPHTLAMVSPWCKNGTIVQYLKENPSVDRLRLIIQISSALAYLHEFKPVVIHGDLKGNNILIGDAGQALLTDFGVSRVIGDFASSGPSSSSLASSFFGGATRWMAPELIQALVEDDSSGGARKPKLTKCSDVYAFASVCFEIMTGQVPYPTRTNPHAVTIDKMRGVKPSQGAQLSLAVVGPGYSAIEAKFWAMMDQCWNEWSLRPGMSELTVFMEKLLQVRGD